MDFLALQKNILQKNNHFDMSILEKAYTLADRVHKNQKRKSGEPYISHPIAVADFLFRIGGDENIVCAALLHDVLEDCDPEEKVQLEEELLQTFGPDVFFLIQAVTKDSVHEGTPLTDEESQKRYYAQFQEAFSLDMTVFFLKMADLLHNAQTIDGLAPEKQKKWIHELKSQYMPIMLENFHMVCFLYHDMYLNLINEAEKIITQYDEREEN